MKKLLEDLKMIKKPLDIVLFKTALNTEAQEK